MDDVDTLHLKDSDPLTYKKAIDDSNSKKWREAMDSEIDNMQFHALISCILCIYSLKYNHKCMLS